MSTFAHQDWNTIVVHKKPTPAAAVAASAKLGTRKAEAGKNGRAGAGKDLRKLDQNEDGGAHEKVTVELRLMIQKARCAKGMTQKALGQAINEKPAVVNSYEQGKAMPSNAVLGKLERALGVKLRGKAATGKAGKNSAARAA